MHYLVFCYICQKSEASAVNPQNRDILASYPCGSIEEGAIAANAQSQVGFEVVVGD